MLNRHKFKERIGAIAMPDLPTRIGGEADDEPQRDEAIELDPRLRERLRFPLEERIPELELPRLCFTRLREGCYTVTFVPKNSLFIRYRGTMRVEHLDDGTYRVSADLYRRLFLVRNVEWFRHRELLLERDALSDTAADTSGEIPVYPRRQYWAYFRGTGSQLIARRQRGQPCPFSLDFEEYRYDHPNDGFDGSFPDTPDRTVRWRLKTTDTPHYYEGTLVELGAGDPVELGTVSVRWVSPHFRRATVLVHTLEGAEQPPASVPNPGGGPAESFRTVFATAGWDLTVDFVDDEVSLPSSLSSVDPTACWSSSNLHRLMESLPEHNPDDLDTVWRVHLVAVPARLGCSRGQMFDSFGDLNDVFREGTATYSHDGYPAGDSCLGTDYGDAEDQRQHEVPRAYLRSAAHEVGHAFNQIHQNFEGGSDNSIMTPTPCVAGVLSAGGEVFPDDIDLAVNDTVRRHLVHLPDPAVRPGAMDFFGAAIVAPEADDVVDDDALEVEVTFDAEDDAVRLGEPVTVRWTLRNVGDAPVPVPERIDAQSLTARVSVTEPGGEVTFLRPVDQVTCVVIPVTNLEPGEERSGEIVAFYGRDGFLFTEPGSHVVEVIALWEVGGIHLGASGSASLWVDHPTGEDDNRVAAQLLDPRVGKAVALGDLSLVEGAADRVERAVSIADDHPACERIQRLGRS